MTISTNSFFMDIHTGQQRPFPAVAIVSMLVLLCLFPCQHWIANLFPGISGLARIDTSLTILDIPVRMPVTVDMILVPGLFIFSYMVVILLYPSRSGMSSCREDLKIGGAVFRSGFVFLLFFVPGGLSFCLVAGYLFNTLCSKSGHFV